MPTRRFLPLNLIAVMFIFILAACSALPAPEGAVDEPKGAVTIATPAQTEPEQLTENIMPLAESDKLAITPGNLLRLAPHLLGLPEYTERILWPAAGTPGIPQEVSLLLQSGPNLHPVVLHPGETDPAGLGMPIPLPLNGNTIVAFAPDASRLLVQEPGRLAEYRIDGSLLREIAEVDHTNWASYSPDSAALVITSPEEFAAYVYGAGGSITKLDGFETAAPVYGAYLGPQGKTLAWISRGTLQFHDATAVKSGLGARLDFSDFIGPVVFSPDGSRLALGVGAELFLYSVPDGKLLAQLALDSPVGSLAFSPAGDILAGNYRYGFQTWNAETLEPLVTLPSGGSETLLVSFSPDGRVLITIHNNNELRVWVVR
jgi:WD40 repeat protein